LKVKLERIKTYEGLIQYFLENTPIDTLKWNWEYYMGANYITDKQYQSLPVEKTEEYNNLAYDANRVEYYHHNYFKKTIQFEIRSSNKYYSSKAFPVEPDDVQKWIQELTAREKYLFMDDDTVHSTEEGSDTKLLTTLGTWYAQGLRLLKEVRDMVDKKVDKEVWNYYMNQWDTHFVDEFYSEQETMEALNLQSELLWYAYRYCTEEYTNYRVWLYDLIFKVKEPLRILQKVQQESDGIQTTPDQQIPSMKWIHSKSLDDALKTLKPLSYLFAEDSLEGLKMALGGGNIFDMKGCIRPSEKNKTKLLFLIYNLIKKGCVEPSDNMDEAIRVLTDTGGSYRKVKYEIDKEYYAPQLDEENLILTLTNALIQ
jgi:hypothetical protein